MEEKVEEEVEEKIEEELEAMDTSETVVETPKGRGGAKKGLEKERLVEDEATAEDEPKENNDDNSKLTPRSSVCMSLTLGLYSFLYSFFI